ncbi:hypothetical protein CM19_01715 [Candidatus Acidianus copahuensis]|uniref:6-phospho-N-acetylmuramidase N-terminal domain-containing protein n=1 Tax=Candidatus Acidianus copahuensis TaxID=1160895 RepID=A0A031LUU8_9CREN|nr:MupG family TIM beta-alpha barrel fold protein [Candidatus Acidianus copahuensis]EZQ11269.1 hypothetical protein CM19_01715 [Candidatus Acidianus copahuensis]
MRTVGITFFPGWRERLGGFESTIKSAWDMGFTEIFVGLGPGTHWRTPVTEAIKLGKDIMKRAQLMGYYVFSDISPSILSQLGIGIQEIWKLRDMGITGVKLDYGFAIDAVNPIISQGMYVELNASTVTEEEARKLTEIITTEKIRASHNYYPVPFTGLSLEAVKRRSSILEGMGIRVGGFIPTSDFKLRTTAEALRELPPKIASQVLFSLGVSRVLIGDPFPTWKDLAEVSRSRREDWITVRLRPYPGIIGDIFGRLFVLDKDKEYAIVGFNPLPLYVPPKNTVMRRRGTVCLVNEKREFTEVWIMKRDAPPDPAFNVIGEIGEEDLRLIELSSKVVFEAHSPIKP